MSRSHYHSSTLQMEAEASTETSVQETLAIRWLTLLKKFLVISVEQLHTLIPYNSINELQTFCVSSFSYTHARTHTGAHACTHTHRGHSFPYFRGKAHEDLKQTVLPCSTSSYHVVFRFERKRIDDLFTK